MYTFVAVYRPPPSPKNSFTFTKFMNEFEDYSNKELIILGDFNIRMDNNTEDPQCIQFNDLLESHNLTQFVKTETHEAGHILDLIISRKVSNCILNVVVEDSPFSDHSFITTKLNISVLTSSKRY